MPKKRITRGANNFLAYFLDTINSANVRDKILKIKQRFKIPKGGFKQINLIAPPPELSQDEVSEIEKEIKSICQSLDLSYDFWKGYLEDIIFYNNFPKDGNTGNTDSSCYFEMPGVDVSDEDKSYYPIAIRISPYASGNEIKDFLQSKIKLIKSFQSKMKKRGSRRLKNNLKRDQKLFELKLSGKGYQEIIKLINREFRCEIDVGYAAVIFSREKKKYNIK